MRVVAIIPARYASSRFPGKPLARIAGKPMIQWVYERTLQAQSVDQVFVATDDERIMAAVKVFGGQAVLTSPEHRNGSERVAEVAADLDAQIVVNVQGDEPLIEPVMIDEAVAPLLDNEEVLIGTLKSSINTVGELLDPNVVKVVTDEEDFALLFSRSPIPYQRQLWQEEAIPTTNHYKHIGLYVYQREFLLKLCNLLPTPLEQAEQLEQLRVMEHGYKITFGRRAAFNSRRS